MATNPKNDDVTTTDPTKASAPAATTTAAAATTAKTTAAPDVVTPPKGGEARFKVTPKAQGDDDSADEAEEYDVEDPHVAFARMQAGDAVYDRVNACDYAEFLAKPAKKKK